MTRKDNTYSDFFKHLENHEEFNPEAFVADDKKDQKICSFILALAIAHNDLKHYIMIHEMLAAEKPKGAPKRSADWGEYFGIVLHVSRIHIGFVHELFQLLRDNKDVLKDDFFVDVVRNIPSHARKAWEALVNASLKKGQGTKYSDPFHMIRNKVIFHYDIKEILSGYKAGFFKRGEILEKACISRGKRMKNVRLYFADKAVEGYFKEKIGDEEKEEFFNNLTAILKDVNLAFYNICTTFIQKRGYPWEKPEE